MPVRITKVKGGFRVSTPHGTKAKRTSRAKAEAQRRLLQDIEHGMRPRRRSRRGK